NVLLAGEADWIQKLHRPWPGDVVIARANLSLFSSGPPAYDRARPGANLVPRGRPVDLWTSPADRPAPCGPWGQPLDNADALPTA
ncbi:MAG: hypothetical protein OXJ56_02910, partial [Rhodospirillaceae bacterium]|nr:hypothetical protein [Rhodospirillaceae bacterium]